MPPSGRRLALLLLFPGVALGQMPPVTTPPPAPIAGQPGAKSEPPAEQRSAFQFSILPKSLQKRPQVDFNVITEMTPAGREVTPPTPDKPAYYVVQPGKFLQLGSAPPGGEHAPPREKLEEAMQKALASAGYLATAPAGQAPSLLVVFNYGSHSINPPVPIDYVGIPVTGDELLPLVAQDTSLIADVLERAALIGGVAFAAELKEALRHELENMRFNQMSRNNPHVPVNPELGSPFRMFVMSAKNSPLVTELVENVFHSHYFVVASAYDYAAVGRGQRRLLWRTKMTVDAQGVNMTETLAPLIVTAGPYLGREMKEAAVLTKRISREGRVEIGTPTVVEDPMAAPKTAAPAETR